MLFRSIDDVIHQLLQRVRRRLRDHGVDRRTGLASEVQLSARVSHRLRPGPRRVAAEVVECGWSDRHGAVIGQDQLPIPAQPGEFDRDSS